MTDHLGYAYNILLYAAQDQDTNLESMAQSESMISTTTRNGNGVSKRVLAQNIQECGRRVEHEAQADTRKVSSEMLTAHSTLLFKAKS